MAFERPPHIDVAARAGGAQIGVNSPFGRDVLVGLPHRSNRNVAVPIHIMFTGAAPPSVSASFAAIDERVIRR